MVLTKHDGVTTTRPRSGGSAGPRRCWFPPLEYDRRLAKVGILRKIVVTCGVSMPRLTPVFGSVSVMNKRRRKELLWAVGILAAITVLMVLIGVLSG